MWLKKKDKSRIAKGCTLEYVVYRKNLRGALKDVELQFSSELLRAAGEASAPRALGIPCKTFLQLGILGWDSMY
jgi:hypothetical protein